MVPIQTVAYNAFSLRVSLVPRSWDVDLCLGQTQGGNRKDYLSVSALRMRAEVAREQAAEQTHNRAQLRPGVVLQWFFCLGDQILRGSEF